MSKQAGKRSTGVIRDRLIIGLAVATAVFASVAAGSALAESRTNGTPTPTALRTASDLYGPR
jgi:hypothetical protein